MVALKGRSGIGHQINKKIIRPLEEARDLKQAMAQALLTGRIRLVVTSPEGR